MLDFSALQQHAPLRARLAGIALGVIASVGCSHGSYTALVTPAPAARPSGCNLDVFDTAEEVGRPFTKVCLISGASGAMATLDEAMGAIRRNACKCGAQAILLGNVQNQGNRMTGITVNMTAYGIVFNDSTSPPGK